MPRVLRIVLLTSVLVFLIWYGHAFYPSITLQMCLESPEQYDGATIIVGNEATIQKIHADGFTIRQMGKLVRVFSAESDVSIGEFVILKATFHKPNELEAHKVRIAKKRRAKIWLSVFPALVVSIYFLRRFRFNFRTLYFEERG
jgi:hypothetical protein